MPERTVLVRDRKSGKIVRVRTPREPTRVRICRACRRPHATPTPSCTAA